MSFGLTLKTLPDAYKRLLAPADRKALGKDGLLSEEIIARGTVKLERDLQKLVESLLRLKGIEPIRSRMDKKTSNNIGTPDFLFCVLDRSAPFDKHGMRWRSPIACAWELKLPGGKLDPEQIKMSARMVMPPNAWRWALITSVDDAIAELRAIGFE